MTVLACANSVHPPARRKPRINIYAACSMLERRFSIQSEFLTTHEFAKQMVLAEQNGLLQLRTRQLHCPASLDDDFVTAVIKSEDAWSDLNTPVKSARRSQETGPFDDQHSFFMQGLASLDRQVISVSEAASSSQIKRAVHDSSSDEVASSGEESVDTDDVPSQYSKASSSDEAPLVKQQSKSSGAAVVEGAQDASGVAERGSANACSSSAATMPDAERGGKAGIAWDRWVLPNGSLLVYNATSHSIGMHCNAAGHSLRRP